MNFLSFLLGLQRIARSSACIERIRTFLISEELQNHYIENHKNGCNVHLRRESTRPDLQLTNISAKWDPDSNEKTLKNINFSANRGSLTAIIGQVGSGKTSLLHLILGELPLECGTIKINGKIVYVSQEPWIFASSIRQNILFGQPLNKSRYDKVIKVCQLERDFSLFPHKDQTIIGEKGINLSGGQRARINLARAVYSEADIYLLDDPLSAVDAHVGRHIFEECICKYLKGKTRILVTHQLHYLQNVDQTYVFDSGSVLMSGTFEDLKNSNLEFLSFMQRGNYDEKKEDFRHEVSSLDFETIDIVSEQEQEGVVEHRTMGRMSKKVYLSYFQAAGSIWILVLVFILSILMPAVINAGDYFLSYWVTWKEGHDDNLFKSSLEGKADELHLGSDDYWYIYIYSGLVAATVVVIFLKHFTFLLMCMRSSKQIHASVFQSVIRTTMAFFHDNPSGRIMNR